jgi:hypothetical protein
LTRRFVWRRVTQADEYHSHRWTVYVRDPENRDLSHVVDKVVFKLHDSFEKPVRVVEAPPFELTETGWGEFEIGITVRRPALRSHTNARQYPPHNTARVVQRHGLWTVVFYPSCRADGCVVFRRAAEGRGRVVGRAVW